MNSSLVELAPGAVWLRGFLPPSTQSELFGRCLALGSNPAGFYSPTRKTGGAMTVAMMCLGLHWNAQSYVYEHTRSDHDGLEAQALPSDFRSLAKAAASAAGMNIEPDICLVNLYQNKNGNRARVGLHRDQSERPETIEAGVPIVSVSLGDDADYELGGLRRNDATTTLRLRSGDILLLGGPSRLRYHAVPRVYESTAPTGVGPGRVNLTFRQL